MLACCSVFKYYNNMNDEVVSTLHYDTSDNESSIFLGDPATFAQMYSNIFDYPLYIGVCLLLMLIYSVMYFFLAIYVERLNPGEFGVSQPWNYLCKRSHWKSSTIRPETSNIDKDTVRNGNGAANENRWLELTRLEKKKSPSMTVDHLNKVTLSFFLQHM